MSGDGGLQFPGELLFQRGEGPSCPGPGSSQCLQLQAGAHPCRELTVPPGTGEEGPVASSAMSILALGFCCPLPQFPQVVTRAVRGGVLCLSPHGPKCFSAFCVPLPPELGCLSRSLSWQPARALGANPASEHTETVGGGVTPART